MKKFFLILFTLQVCLGCTLNQTVGPDEEDEFRIYSGMLYPGFDIGVAHSSGNTNWLEEKEGFLKMSYPSGEWGSVFFVTGTVSDPPRPSEDFSDFKKLAVELRGESGGECVEIGIKDVADPDNGEETKIPITLTDAWTSYVFPLSDFFTADLENLYVVAEVVFTEQEARTVYLQRIVYVP